MRYIKFMVTVIIIMLVIIIIIQNHEAFATKLTFRLDLNMFTLNYRSAEISIYNITAIAFLSGVIITGVFGMMERFRLKRQLKDLYKIIRDKDKELNSLRNLPITSDLSGNIDEMIK